jgi:hypothetical protein
VGRAPAQRLGDQGPRGAARARCDLGVGGEALKKIANNPDYSVTVWNVSIMIDRRGADVTFDRRDTDDGKVIQQPAKTVRLVRGPAGLVVVR